MTRPDTRGARFGVEPRKAPPPACIFGPGQCFRPGLSRVTGPDTSRRSFFKKNPFGEFENPPKSLPFRLIDPRGRALITAPGPDRGRFSRGFSLRAGRSDGVGYSRSSISSRAGCQPVQIGPTPPVFWPGPNCSPRSLRSDGPGYLPEVVFSIKNSSANSETLQEACLFASSIRGEEPSSQPQEPDRGRKDFR